MNKKIKEIIEALEFMCKTGDVSKIALESLKNGLEELDEQLNLSGVRKCNGKKDPNIVKTYALITRKDGLTDVWCEGECLGKGLDTDGINKLNL